MAAVDSKLREGDKLVAEAEKWCVLGWNEELVEDILHVACVMHKWWYNLVSRPWNFCCHLFAPPAKIVSQATPNQPKRGSPRACY